MSEEFEQKKRNVINALNSVLRTSALKDHDCGQQMLILMVDQLLDRAGPEGALQLYPIFDYLQEKGIDEDDILEALLVFKEREGTFGLPLTASPTMAALPKERRQKLLLRYQKRQRASRATTPPSPSPSASASASPSAASPGFGEIPVTHAGGSKARTRALIFGLLAVCGGGIGALAWQKQALDPPAVDVVVDDPKGLTCPRLKGNHGVLMCWMHQEAYQKLGPSERKTRSQATKAAASGLGYRQLQLWTIEDRKLREVH